MTSEELAHKVGEVCQEAIQRIVGVGHEQYVVHTESVVGPTQVQRWEIDSLDADLAGLEEELLDTINHAAMSVLKIRRLREEADRNA